MSTFSAQDMSRLERYLQRKFGNKTMSLRSRGKTTDSVEVLIDGEFIATIYKDEDEGETSYDLNMAILEDDLAVA